MDFESKEKLPKLSQEMQDIINRSHKDNVSDSYDDTERYKYQIMNMLTNNQDILWTLHNKTFEKDENGNINTSKELNGDCYRDVNIFSFLKIPDVQSEVKNFICFEVDDVSVPYDSMIKKNITFRTISHLDDFKTDWGIARQDLLAAIIKNEFDWSNIFGMHLEKVYDKGRITENGYYYREFIYETIVPNNLVNKSKNGGVTYERYKKLK